MTLLNVLPFLFSLFYNPRIVFIPETGTGPPTELPVSTTNIDYEGPRMVLSAPVLSDVPQGQV